MTYFQIRKTMKAIKTALTERWYVWEDARKLAEKDRTINLNGDLVSPAYSPTGIFEASATSPVGLSMLIV